MKSSSTSQQISRSQFDIRNVDLDMDRSIYDDSKSTSQLNVPKFILSCIEYLEEHGLQKVGLFRVSTSKKRLKQLRDDFDKNRNMCIPDNTCPHDVATLLKEFLRDLPEPLLCNRLYSTFLETQKIRNRRLQLEAISHLIKLLPIAHRDTLFVLLRFLANVATHCDDILDNEGKVHIRGNKMDSNNLSTVFAPNILREDTTAKSTERREQGNMSDGINVIRIMIDHFEDVFKVPGDVIDILYSHMLDTCPDKLNDVIKSKLNKSLSAQGAESMPQDSQFSIEDSVVDSNADTQCNVIILCEGRRQSTLQDSKNVFSASLQISNMDQISTKQLKHSGVSHDEPKLPTSISNIGGATLYAKTAEFEKTAGKKNNLNVSQHRSSRGSTLYKRQQLISSSRR
ncbi:maker369 [Drosophila busckii]|uniref:Maker369 n=1 Tax=Drosophila busckii TaxID=30019 RepID=A0A0M4EHI2_DROBS|nr:rho GTPase-activating protein 6 [Drosophila busckii]ALC48091.1 maker369 [Drosophila busckii]